MDTYSDNMHISVVIPAFNEERTIEDTIAHVYGFLEKRNVFFEIIVVDDGSSDSTSEVVGRLQDGFERVRLIRHERNRGKGKAISSGAMIARGQVIVLFDADCSTTLDEFSKAEALLSTGHAIVIGSRYLPDSYVAVRQPLYRIALSRFGNRLIQTILLKGIVDTQCGFKVFTREAAEFIFPRQTIWRWAFDIELLAIARSRGFVIGEIPVRWQNSVNRPSRFKALRDSLRTLRDLLRIKINLMRGLYR